MLYEARKAAATVTAAAIDGDGDDNGNYSELQQLRTTIVRV